jgi:dTDP-4-dehydrorhamnose reductase
MTKIVLIGASGFLGWHLAHTLKDRGAVWGTYCSNEVAVPGVTTVRLDFASPSDIAVFLRKVTPDVVIHAAAMINVDVCEREKTRAKQINEDATEIIAGEAASMGARLIYCSTDMVFDGLKGMYSEEDRPRPTTCYGATKLAGEKWVTSANQRNIVMRLSLMYGIGHAAHGSFLDWLMGRLNRGDAAPLFTDQFRTPLFVGDVCDAVCACLDRGAISGIYHLAGAERLNRYDFGIKVAERFGFPKGLLNPVLMAQLPSLLPRPRDVSLRNEKAARAFGIRFKTVDEGLSRITRQAAR